MSTVKIISAKDVKEGDFIKGIGKVESVSIQSHMVVLRCGKKKTILDEDDKVTLIQKGEY